MHAAARGSLSVPPNEVLEILVHLANHNKIFGQQARMTLAGWDEAASRKAASDPATQQEILDYMIARDNLRPVLLPELLENPSVREESLIELAATGPREVVDAMFKSSRVQQSQAILNALKSNERLSTDETKGVAAKVDEEDEPLFADPDRVLADTADAPAEADEVLDEGLVTYLSEHAAEIDAEADKPFQPIGGIYEETSSVEEPLNEAPPAAAANTAAAAQPKRQPGKKASLSHNEERGTALQKISKLDVKGRIQLALKGTKEERSLLVRDGTKIVALAVLDSPKISDGEVEKYASQKNVLEAVLRGIPMKRRFAKNYAVLRNLVFNPRTPLDVSLGLMKHIMVHDLRHLSGNKEVSETVRKLALKLVKAKADPSKKSTD
jgi:hypothetical protein